ncbi:hypothetical protein PQX77_002294 [Marasmius sp. AFHP31]|nr:hypothetical protein PQX77_002294 [Marasmius sp. AFHP31]
MPAERSRGARRSGADGYQLVWTIPVEPAWRRGISFTTNVTPITFNEPMTDKEPIVVDDPSSPRRPAHFKKKLENHIPSPPNAFILFRSSFLKNQRISTETENNHSTLSKIIGLTWQNLPDDERQVWHSKAKQALDDFKRKFPQYAFRPSHSKGKGGTEKRKVREVGPKDLKRCAKIAELLVEGKKGQELDAAIREFDENYAPETPTSHTSGPSRFHHPDYRDEDSSATTQDDTSGTNSPNPFHSRPSTESDPVQTHSQTNWDTADNRGSSADATPSSAAAQDNKNSADRLDVRSQQGDPATTQSHTNRNHNGDNYDRCTVGRASRDTYNVEGSHNNVVGSHYVEDSYNVENRVGLSAIVFPQSSIFTPTEPHDTSPFSLPHFVFTDPSVWAMVLISVLPAYCLLSRSSYLISDS